MKAMDPTPLRRSTRISKGHDMSNYYLYNSENYEKVKVIQDLRDPATYSQALEDTNSNNWISDMNEELDSIQKNGAWRLVKRQHGMKIVGCK